VPLEAPIGAEPSWASKGHTKEQSWRDGPRTWNCSCSLFMLCGES